VLAEVWTQQPAGSSRSGSDRGSPGTGPLLHRSLSFADSNLSLTAPMASPQSGARPLHYAAEGGHVATIRTLLNGGAAVDARDAVRRRPRCQSVLVHAIGRVMTRVLPARMAVGRDGAELGR
jgi:hypothetical protein